MESSISLLHLGPPNSVEIDVIEYPVEKYPELAASLQQPNDVAGAPTRLTQLPATITCVRLRFQDRELTSQIQTLQSLLDEKEEKLQEARWKEESHAEVLQDWMLQMRELEKANGDLQEQAAMASKDLQKQAGDAERLRESLQGQIKSLETELGATRHNAVLFGAERSTLQRQVDELAKLVKTMSAREHMPSIEDVADNPSMEEVADSSDPFSDRSLPLKYETLKPSLSHAQKIVRPPRTRPDSRIHDIEFATEISKSLMAEVRNLQALLSEREEELKEVKRDRSRLELEAEGFQRPVVDDAGLTERRTATRNPSFGGKITPSLVYSSTSDKEQSDFPSNVQPDVHTAAEVTLPDTLLGRDS